jgi:hypothetical protein
MRISFDILKYAIFIKLFKAKGGTQVSACFISWISAAP